ncbi:MAG: tripartite tricarboxylate transporter receptor family protein [Betaproteobacteria bacterium]|nr:tripartite tricarboxylate transporter receptor family protein [Betaproteobacteria bacterium]
MRAAWRAGLLALAWLCTAGSAHALAYPDHPVRMVVPFPPAGAADLGARIVSEALAGVLKQPVIIDNRPGANGNIGAENLAKSAPDGYSIMFAPMSTLTINPYIYAKASFSVDRDMAPVAKIFDTALVIEANPGMGFKTLGDLIAYAKKNPGKLSFASGGNGSSTHMMGELFKNATHTDLLHVPYKGNGPALADVLGGAVSLMFDQVVSSAQHIASGRLTALAVTSGARQPLLPNVPTVGELGYRQLEMSAWQAVMVPAGTPAPVIDKLAKALAEVLAQPAVRQRLEGLGATVSVTDPAGLARVLQEESARWKLVVAQAKIKPE